MIRLYNKSKHLESIQHLMLWDKEWSSLCWCKWLFDLEDPTYRSISYVYDIEWIPAWLVSCSSDSMWWYFHIDCLYVWTKYRKRWVWRDLIDECFKYYSWLWLNTCKLTVFNSWPIWFYEKLWFKQSWTDSYEWTNKEWVLYLYKVNNG